MKLRNKKTGEIYEIVFCPLKEEWKETDENRLLVIRDCNKPWKKNIYKTLAELNEDWEDAPDINVGTLPLIKDEKSRKSVRAWAEANDYEEDDNYEFNDFQTGYKSWSLEHKSNGDYNEIHFNGGINFEKVRHQSLYTIAELCGEEKE